MITQTGRYIAMTADPDSPRYVDIDDHPGPMSSGYPYLSEHSGMARAFSSVTDARKMADLANGTFGSPDQKFIVAEIYLVEVDE